MFFYIEKIPRHHDQQRSRQRARSLSLFIIFHFGLNFLNVGSLTLCLRVGNSPRAILHKVSISKRKFHPLMPTSGCTLATDLHNILWNNAAIFKDNLHPLEQRCTLLNYTESFWPTLHPSELHRTLWPKLQPSELRCTLLRIAAPNLATLHPTDLRCTQLIYAAPNWSTPHPAESCCTHTALQYVHRYRDKKIPMPEPVWYRHKDIKSGTGLRWWMPKCRCRRIGLDDKAQLWLLLHVLCLRFISIFLTRHDRKPR